MDSVVLATHAGAQGLERATAAPQIKTLPQAARFFFSHNSPRVMAAKLAIVLIVRAWFGAFTWWDLAVVGAVAVFWPFMEWWAHIYLLHMKPRKIFGRTFDPMASHVHRDHHRRPWNIHTAFLPVPFLIWVAIPINVVFWWLVMPSRELAATGIAAFTAAALLYEWTHYLTHTGYRARSKFYGVIWRNHRLHHFKNEHYWHSFVLPVIDKIFKTAPDHHDVEISPTCRTLGMGEDDDLGTQRDS